jgi:hypothetical protein
VNSALYADQYDKEEIIMRIKPNTIEYRVMEKGGMHKVQIRSMNDGDVREPTIPTSWTDIDKAGNFDRSGAAALFGSIAEANEFIENHKKNREEKNKYVDPDDGWRPVG